MALVMFSTFIYFNPRSPRGERLCLLRRLLRRRAISIHAPRVGSDSPLRIRRFTWSKNFNPRSPRGERHVTDDAGLIRGEFQSTLPAWGATMAQEAAEREMVFQSTLPAWGATRAACWSADSCSISIHAPRVGSDTGGEPGGGSGDIFQSTLPAWGATSAPSPCGCSNAISIHAPRVGSDGWRVWREWIFRYFNPRSPRGERRQPRAGRRARRVISIHAPRVGSDTTAYVIGGYPAKFQSTLPAWGATSIVPSARSTLHFNPRSPRGERPRRDTALST